MLWWGKHVNINIVLCYCWISWFLFVDGEGAPFSARFSGKRLAFGWISQEFIASSCSQGIWIWAGSFHSFRSKDLFAVVCVVWLFTLCLNKMVTLSFSSNFPEFWICWVGQLYKMHVFLQLRMFLMWDTSNIKLLIKTFSLISSLNMFRVPFSGSWRNSCWESSWAKVRSSHWENIPLNVFSSEEWRNYLEAHTTFWWYWREGILQLVLNLLDLRVHIIFLLWFKF